MKMKRILSILLATIMIFSLVGCNSKQGGSENEPMTLKIGAFFDFKYPTQEPLSLVTDFLAGIDENYNAVPGLIKDWVMSDDATEYTLHLEENVTFHDDSAFNAEACKYSLETLGAKYYATYVYMLDTIDVVDETTLTVKFNSPHLFFMEELYKIPALAVGSVDEEGNILKHIGTGPYTLDTYEENVQAKLVKNKNYWNKEKVSDVDIVEWIVIPDGDARISALESGQVDVVGYSEMGRMIPAASVGTLESKEGFRVIREGIDTYAGICSIATNYLSSPMDDENLRLALAYAIDRELLVDTVFYGEVAPVEHMMNPNFIDGTADVEPFTYNLEKAKQILSDAGYVLENDVLSLNAEPIELDFIAMSGSENIDFAVFVQSELAKLGITINIETFDMAIFMEKMMNLEYDIALNGMGWFAPTISHISYYGTEAVDITGFGLGYGANEDLQSAANNLLIASNMDDYAVASDVFWAEMYKACISIPTYSVTKATIHSDDWTGFNYDRNIFMIDLSKVTKNND